MLDPYLCDFISFQQPFEVWSFVTLPGQETVTQTKRFSQLESGEGQSVFIHDAMSLLKCSLLLTAESGSWGRHLNPSSSCPSLDFKPYLSSHTPFLAPFHWPPSCRFLHCSAQAHWFTQHVFLLRIFPLLILSSAFYYHIIASSTSLDLTSAKIPFPAPHVSFPLFLKHFISYH